MTAWLAAWSFVVLVMTPVGTLRVVVSQPAPTHELCEQIRYVVVQKFQHDPVVRLIGDCQLQREV